jgi:prevent-host-death family protein
MKKVSLSQARNKLSSLISTVVRTGKEILITKNGQPAAYLVDASKYESLRETAAIRSDVALMRGIRQGIKDLSEGRAQSYSLEELFK